MCIFINYSQFVYTNIFSSIVIKHLRLKVPEISFDFKYCLSLFMVTSGRVTLN